MTTRIPLRPFPVHLHLYVTVTLLRTSALTAESSPNGGTSSNRLWMTSSLNPMFMTVEETSQRVKKSTRKTDHLVSTNMETAKLASPDRSLIRLRLILKLVP